MDKTVFEILAQLKETKLQCMLIYKILTLAIVDNKHSKRVSSTNLPMI